MARLVGSVTACHVSCKAPLVYVFNSIFVLYCIDKLLKLINLPFRYPSLQLPWVMTALSEEVLRLGGNTTEGIFR